MKQLVVLFLSGLALNAFAVVEIGQTSPNLCYTDINQKQFCLHDYKDQVVVLIHNAGWCGPCNAEMAELAPASKEFANQTVTFISLSGAGWSQGSNPDVTFLKQWKTKHQIPDYEASGVSFIVAASPRDFGKTFIAPPIYVPNSAILDEDSVLADKGINVSVTQIMNKVRSLLAKP